MQKTGVFSKKNIRLIIFSAITLILCSSIIISMFSGLIRRYERTTAYESAGHLIEISSQIKLNIEHTIYSDRNLAQTIAASINHHVFQSETELLSYLRQMRQAWGVSRIHIYNYSGLCIDENDTVEKLENGAETAYRTIKKESSFNIEQSSAEYAVAVTTPFLLRGSRIAAVSVVRDLDTMIETMDIRSFDGKSAVYLTRQNGVCISQTQNNDTRKVFNITALFDGGRPESISEKNIPLEKAMNTNRQTVFIYDEQGISKYAVLTPVRAGKETWFLFFIVPHSVVNKTMYSYSSYITLFMILSTVFMCGVLLVFMLVYQHKNEQYTEDLRIRDNDLRRALVLADSANKAKTVFLSNMSHDIRTPMNAIINMTQFTIDNYDNREKAMGYLRVIQESSDHLLKLINDVLDMSRIESGKMSFADDPFSMKDTIEAICAMIHPLCDCKKQVFTCDYAPFMHDNLRGDSVRLTRILINLLNNAVKFTPEEGNIVFRISELSSLSRLTASFRFEVQDSGIGISQDDLSRIFDPFTRAETSSVRRTEGSGLGLSISKRIVEAMGGSISVQSAIGSGSTFTIELFFPVSSSRSKPAVIQDSSKHRKSFAGKRALLVEDNEINREIATIMLENLGFTVKTAEDGSDAVHIFDAVPAHYYDIIYMDIQMARMNGYEASSAIRSLQKEDAAVIPIIAMTANVFAEDIEKARKAGMSAHIAKPIDPEKLQEVTDSVFSRSLHTPAAGDSHE